MKEYWMEEIFLKVYQICSQDVSFEILLEAK